MIKIDYLLFIALAFFSGFFTHWAVESVWWHQPTLAFFVMVLAVAIAGIAVWGVQEKIK